MAEAEVGDDVFGDDPTINALQERCAELLGKEAALFVPTGSMGNQVCMAALARPGDEILCEAGAHFLHYEGGSMSTHHGLMMHPLPGRGGVIDSQQVAAAIRTGTEHNPHTAVVSIENTHNAAGGRVFPLDEAQAVAKICREQNVAVHIDGARIFNAQAATGTPAREWAACGDTITFCFSKGLGAPVGSMACGPAEVLEESHRIRKRLGGGMRQAGVLAAAAMVSLDEGIERLSEDHENARRLAEGLADLHPGAVDLDAVETNMVMLDLRPFSKTGPEVEESVASEGVIVSGRARGAIRLVTHRDVTSEDVDRALATLRKVLV
jgi:threonine aldolase